MPMDEEGFCVFYDQTARNLRAYLRSVLTDDLTLVDDILQESYFRFLKAALPVGMDPAWRKNYLYRIATNIVRDHRRSRQMEQLPPERECAALENSLEETNDIKDAFGRLKPKERDLLWLAYVECFSHQEIAGFLSAKTASIRPMLARARAKFADLLKRRGYGA
jgi:RNA polymerase sigma-70 factor, ECF subfamily